MSLASLSHLMPSNGYMPMQQDASLYKVSEQTVGTPSFADELDSAKVTQASVDGAPLSLVNKTSLEAKRPVATLSTTEEPVAISTQELTATSQESYVSHEDDEFGFWDLVDLVNPLQHLPIIGTIYRKVTGDEIKPEVQVAGSILMGVATGSILLSAASGVASVVFEEHTGKDPVTMLAGALFGDDEEKINLDELDKQKILMAEAEIPDSLDPEAPREFFIPQAQSSQLAAAQPQAIPQVVDQVIAQEAQTMTTTLMEQQAKMNQIANPTSKEFIQEFMSQALDKYKMAHSSGLGNTALAGAY